MPYSCNDNIKGVGNLSSLGSSEFNVMSLFNTNPRAKRSHGHKLIQHPNVKKSSKPRPLQDTFNGLLSNIQKALGIHHIHTILFSLPVNYLTKETQIPFLPSTDCLVLYVTWCLFVFSNQFDLNLFMTTTENSSIFRLLILWKDLFTHNTEEYCMLSTVGRFIYTKYWEILYVEHCGNIYLNTILGITLR